jgi:hypothetical protein
VRRYFCYHKAVELQCHRPGRVEPAFEVSLDRLGLKYLDLYLIHTPFAFQPGDEQDPRDQNGNVLYDHDVTLLGTWGLISRPGTGSCPIMRLSRSHNPRGQRKRRRRDGGLQATKPLQLSCYRAAGSGVQLFVRGVEDNCCIALIF